MPGFAGYRFGLADEQISPVRKPLEQLPVTDNEGKAEIGVQLPALTRTNRPLEADVILKLREFGRAHHRAHHHAARRHEEPRIGIKQLFTGGQVAEGDMARFDAVMLGADGKAIEPRA